VVEKTGPTCLFCEKSVVGDDQRTVTVRRVRTGSEPRPPPELAHQDCFARNSQSTNTNEIDQGSKTQ
jgi:hypothetical protein